jgi:hypothetical protein
MSDAINQQNLSTPRFLKPMNLKCFLAFFTYSLKEQPYLLVPSLPNFIGGDQFCETLSSSRVFGFARRVCLPNTCRFSSPFGILHARLSHIE